MPRHLMTLLLAALVTSTLFADVPRTISYQGRLTSSGAPINGVRSVTFRIYSGGGTPIWNSGSVNVTFTEGLFTVDLGQSPQPPLFVEGWSSDTAMSLGVTIAPNPELSPRLHFKTAPYAMHAMTAEWANFGGGWLHQNGVIRLENPNDSIGIGTTTPQAKVGISTTGNERALRINSNGADIWKPAMELIVTNNVTGAIFRQGLSTAVPGTPLPAVYAVSEGAGKVAAYFESRASGWQAVGVSARGAGEGIRVAADNYCVDAWYGKGIRAVADSATAIRAESHCDNAVATVLSSVYTGTANYDHIAVSGYSRPADYYGIGGSFEGGYVGVEGKVNASADKTYYGVRGLVFGGEYMSYGVSGEASGNLFNCGIHGAASGGIYNWAGWFEGDVSVDGTIVNSANTLAIDHPTNPDNGYLQQAGVISDNFKAVYDGIVTLGSDGTAVVQLPEWLESFCGDFRYQLTCVGGYAPIYVASKIANSKFTIAGGTPGLEVSWQVTGIRKDKYAQANPLEVEKKKTVSEQGKYLHPELFGYGSEKSLSSNPDRDPSVKAKNDAIRATATALTKPSTPPKQPVMMEKK